MLNNDSYVTRYDGRFNTHVSDYVASSSLILNIQLLKAKLFRPSLFYSFIHWKKRLEAFCFFSRTYVNIKINFR